MVISSWINRPVFLLLTDSSSGRRKLLSVVFWQSMFVLAALFLSASPARAQGTVRGTVHGMVADSGGAAVVDAEVVLKNLATNVASTAKTTASGVYNFPFVDPGEYRMVVSKEGFQSVLVEHVKVETQANVSVDAQMKVGAVTQQVTVSAETQSLDTGTAGVSGVVSTAELEHLPNNGQQYAQLIRLEPGVVAGYLTTGSSSGSSFGGSGYIAGRRIGDNAVYIDGAMFYDPWSPSQTVTGLLGGPGVSQEAIDEFRVVGNNPKPDEGFTAGGRIDLTTKSGGNTFHGSAYDYLRNNVLDARDYFAPKRLPLKRNLFGASAGGPIVKDKSFFFASYEGMRQRKLIPQSPIVPTPLLLAAVPGGAANNFLREILTAEFPRPLLGTYSPTALVAPFITSSNAAIDYNLFSARWDYKLSDNNSISARYIFNTALGSPGAVTSTGIPSTDGGTNDRWQQALVSWTSVISPNTVSETRLAYHREYNAFPTVETPAEVTSCCGVAQSLTDPRGNPVITFSGTGLTAIGPVARKPQSRTINVYQLDESVSATRGSHLITVGGTGMMQQVNDLFPQGLRAQVTFVGFGAPFDNSPTGLTTGKVFSETQTFAQTPLGFYRDMGRKQLAVFGQDKWQMTSALTFNLGLRYELVGRPYAANNGFNNLFHADSTGEAIADAPITNIANVVVRTVGDCSGCLNLTRLSTRNFAPRLGIAWRARPKLVVRAGYGVQYGEMIFNLLSFNRQNPGFTRGVTLAGKPFTLDLSGAPASNPPVFAYAPGMGRPYTEDWNLTAEYALTESTSLETSYVANRGKKLLRPFAPNLGSGFAGTRPNPNFGQISLWNSAASSYYDALQLSFKRRFSSGLHYQVSYTYSKSLDDASGEITAFSDLNYPTDPLHPSADKGRSDFDLTHVFVTNLVYQLPFGRNRRFLSDSNLFVSGLLGGWQASAIVTLDSGQPYTFLSGKDVNGDGIANDRARLLVSNPTLVFHGLSETQFLNPAAVNTELSSTTGTIIARNTFNGPAYKSVDFAVGKTFTLLPRRDQPLNLEFRAQAYNLFNRANFAQPNTTVSSPAFGKITNTVTGARNLEVALKLTF
jgi:hypothetical protein